MALSDLIDFRVEFGLGSFAGTGVYGTSLYGTGTYGASGGGGIQWTDMTQLCQGFTTSSGKSLSQPSLKRFRTANAQFFMDNTTGVFTPGSPEIPGFLQLRPGRYVRILARPADTPDYPIRLPNGQQWPGVTGRTWQAHGSDLFLDVAGGGYQPIWFGRIDTIDNVHRDADLTATIRCTDAFAQLSVNNTVGQPPAGAGDTASERITRLLDYYQWPDDRRDIAAGGYKMQAETFARGALELLQLTSDSTGGDFWQKPDGALAFRDQDWMSNTVDWFFGGINGLPIRSMTPAWSVFNIRNETHYARAGGTEQVSVDGNSQVLYGRRTHTRLDFITESDVDVASLGALVVNELAQDRMFLEQASVLVQDAETADFVVNISIGDLLQITVDTVFGWANTYLANVIAIADDVTPQGWIMTLGLQDATRPNEHGPYSRDEFNEAFHLGGPEPAAVI